MSGVGTEKGSTYPDVVIPEVSLSKFMLDRIGKYGNKVAMVNNGLFPLYDEMNNTLRFIFFIGNRSKMPPIKH